VGHGTPSCAAGTAPMSRRGPDEAEQPPGTPRPP
jgi:hypothetical protein